MRNEQIPKGSGAIIMTPEHIKSHKAPNLHLSAQCGWRFSEFYKWIRESNTAIADGSPKKWSSFEQVDI